MVPANLPVPGRPANLDYRRARAFFACSRCGWGLFGHFTLVFLFTSISPSLSETVRYSLKYCLKGPFNPNQPTNLALWPTEVVLTCDTSSCFDDHLCQIIINSTMHDEVMVGHDSETRKLLVRSVTLTFSLATWFLQATHCYIGRIILPNSFQILPCTMKLLVGDGTGTQKL